VLEYSIIQTRGFTNVIEDGRVTGFQLLVRMPNSSPLASGPGRLTADLSQAVRRCLLRRALPIPGRRVRREPSCAGCLCAWLVPGHGQRTLPLARACQRAAGGGAMSSAWLVAAQLASSRSPSWDGVPGSAA
jgi:hypothetical protein